MATGDLSRSAYYPHKRFSGVRMQQGRVLTDDDFNEQEQINHEDKRLTSRDVIGIAGSPDHGFAISNVRDDAGYVDFDIATGTFYIGGIRVPLLDSQTFRLQTDWLQIPDFTVPADERHDMVYMEVWQQNVSAVEDSELIEKALGGPDTSTRRRTMCRIKLQEDVVSNDCPEAWQQVKDVIQNGIGGVWHHGTQLSSDGQLTVDYEETGDEEDLCSPSVLAGYLGAENQAIRVQLVDRDHFTWGFDNGAPLYRVTLEDAASSRNTIKLLTDPKDQAHWPKAGQVVEILPWSAVLLNGEKLAEEISPGHFSTLDSSYDPDSGEITLTTALSANYGEQWKNRADKTDLEKTHFGTENLDSEYFFLRVWDRGSDTSSDASIAVGNNVVLGNTGINITITGDNRMSGDHWIIAARPHTPDQVTPWQLEVQRESEGYHRFIAPLAIIHWHAPNEPNPLVYDCRKRFRSLTEQKGCCTFEVGDGVHSRGDFDSIQTAINALPEAGGRICVLEGDYQENLIINNNNVSIQGCGARTHLIPNTDDPAIKIEDVSHIAISNMQITAHDDGIGILISEGIQTTEHVTLTQLKVNAATRSAIQANAGRFLTIRDNSVLMQDVSSAFHAIFVTADDVLIEHNEITIETGMVGAANTGSVTAGRGGIQIGGGSERVSLVDNYIWGGIGNGITLGSVQEVDANGKVIVGVVGWVVNAYDPCDPCTPGSAFIPPDATANGTYYQTTGSLYDIRIERNRIQHMGLNGIGVVSFFDLDAEDEFISVDGLKILGNNINDCLWRDLEVIPDNMKESMGYGGIALADVDDLIIHDNVIENNGPNHLNPICGIFVLHAEGVDIIRNRILNNGAKTDISAEDANMGPRAGIHITYGTAPKIPVIIGDEWFPRQNGVPAVRIYDNIVAQALGRALSIKALGPVSVKGNQLTSQGVMSDYSTPSFVASTVGIFNLGISNELYLQQLLFSGEAIPDSGVGVPQDPEFIMEPRRGVDDSQLFAYIGNGNIMFNDNQVVLDLMDKTGFKFSLTSIGLFTLDDIAFTDNQCDANFDFVLDDFVIANTLLVGWSLRATGNRFKENIFSCLYSALTLSFFANMTAINQGSHCIQGINLIDFMGSNVEVNKPNAVMFDIWKLCGDDPIGTLPGNSIFPVIAVLPLLAVVNLN